MSIKKIQTYLDAVFRDITALGSFAFFLLLLLFILVSGKILLFRQLGYGFLFTFVAVIVIRVFYFKDRPHKQHFSSFVERIDASSFPSLHTARVVMLVLFLIDFFKNDSVTAFLTVLAFLIMYSRVHLHKHDWTDIAGGIILGVITFLLGLLIF